MSYNRGTYDKVVSFLIEKKEVLKTELLYLGNEKRQINPATLQLILDDLESEKKIKITETNVGSRTFTQINWRP